MSNTQTISTYQHCGTTEYLDVTEVPTYFGPRLVITKRSDRSWGPQPEPLHLNHEQTAALEKFFLTRGQANAADPTPTDDGEEDASWGEPLDDAEAGTPALA